MTKINGIQSLGIAPKNVAFKKEVAPQAATQAESAEKQNGISTPALITIGAATAAAALAIGYILVNRGKNAGKVLKSKPVETFYEVAGNKYRKVTQSFTNPKGQKVEREIIDKAAPEGKWIPDKTTWKSDKKSIVQKYSAGDPDSRAVYPKGSSVPKETYVSAKRADGTTYMKKQEKISGGSSRAVDNLTDDEMIALGILDDANHGKGGFNLEDIFPDNFVFDDIADAVGDCF